MDYETQAFICWDEQFNNGNGVIEYAISSLKYRLWLYDNWI